MDDKEHSAYGAVGGKTDDFSTGSIPSYVLDDLGSRFIINEPVEELQEARSVFFKLEVAYWFYLDFHRAENPSLPEASLKEFSFNLMNHCTQLKQYISNFHNYFEEWKSYTRKISTYGAIIMDKELKNVLLVQSYASKTSWGFPKGKINNLETPVNCAVREVFEEIGFDISGYINENEFLEMTLPANEEKKNRLYIIAGVPITTIFQPKTRREIRDIQWFPIEALPTYKGDHTLKEAIGQNINLYSVTPFLKELRKWITRQTTETNQLTNKQKNRLKQQKLFTQQTQNHYQEYMNLKKGRDISKKQTGPKSSFVIRYSGDIISTDARKQSKQGKRILTVGQTLFNNKEGQITGPEEKIPELDTNSFYSKTWHNFTLDVDGIIKLLP